MLGKEYASALQTAKCYTNVKHYYSHLFLFFVLLGFPNKNSF